MIKETRTVWTEDGREVLIRKDFNDYSVPGASFSLEELRTLEAAIVNAIREADEYAKKEPSPPSPPF